MNKIIVLLGSLFASYLHATPPLIWVTGSMVRVGPSDPAGIGVAAQISAGRGEWESFQIVIKGQATDLTNVTVTVSSLSGPNSQVIPQDKVWLFREQYVYVSPSSPDWGGSNRPLGAGYYADGLIPFRDPTTGSLITGATLSATPFSVPAGKNQPIWVDVFVPRNTQGGVYHGTFTVTSDQGSVGGTLALTVWNFTLPVKPT